MKPILLAAAAVVAFATAAQAQPGPGGGPPDFDADHDGKVTLAEFKAGQAERQNRMFARIDTNKDGKITKDELDAMAKRAEDAGRGPPPGAGPGGMMMRLDANHDGVLTKAELAADTDRRFKMADTNGDGWLSKGELIMMRQKMRGGPGPQ